MLDSVAKFREILSQKYLTLHSMKEKTSLFCRKQRKGNKIKREREGKKKRREGGREAGREGGRNPLSFGV